MPAQKRKVGISEMRARETDPQPIRDIFNNDTFDMIGWLNSLTPDGLAEYSTIIEKKGTTTNQIQNIVDRVPLFRGIKVHANLTNVKLKL